MIFPEKISIKAARVNKGWNQKKAASEIGTSVFALSNYECGVTSPTMEIAEKMSAVYDVPLENLEFPKRKKR